MPDFSPWRAEGAGQGKKETRVPDLSPWRAEGAWQGKKEAQTHTHNAERNTNRPRIDTTVMPCGVGVFFQCFLSSSFFSETFSELFVAFRIFQSFSELF